MQVPEVIRAAVVGCGAISKEHLSFLASTPTIDLVGVSDLSPAARHYARSRYGAGADYASAEALLEQARPDVVHVLTPPATHRALAIACLEAGAHVVCEKPVAATLNDLDEMFEVADRAGKLLIESQNYRFNDGVVSLRDLVESGELGEIREVEIRITLDIASGGKFGDGNVPSPVAGLRGGAIHDFLPHMAYSALQMLPDDPIRPHDPIREVWTSWRNLSGNPVVGFDELDSSALVGDALVRMRFSSFVKPEGFRIIVRGTRGSAETDCFQPFLRVEIPRARGPLSPLANHAYNGASLLRSSISGLKDKVLQRTPYHGMAKMLDQFYRAVQDGSPSPITPDQIRRPMELVEALVAQAPAR